MTGERTLQDANYGAEFDYDVGSPHLRHRSLNSWMVSHIRNVVQAQLDKGPARVLEIGAGHGNFTEHVAAMGAEVTVTEMSEASADLLDRRYRHNPAVSVVFDPSGESPTLRNERFDVVLAISVLHHIPDYLAAIRAWNRLLNRDGAFVSFQDPLWYPRRTRANLWLDRGSYLAWRAGRGDLLAGLGSIVRRSTNRMDESNARDMVEYHVLRNGCDEQAVMNGLRADFADVELLTYWSTQAPLLQRAGERIGLVSTFGVLANGRSRDTALPRVVG